MATILCDRVTTEKIRVIVEYPKSRERRRECCNGLGREFARSACDLCRFPFNSNVFLSILAVAITLAILLLVGDCQRSPGLDLKDVNVHAMNVYENNTLSNTTDTAYQVNSLISVQLEARNRNSVTGCFTTFRRVAVSVDFKGQRLLHQVLLLERFGLKPGESRNMTLELKGENAPLKNEIGSLLASEVRNTGAVELTLSFASRWMRNDRKAAWMSMNCSAITKAPPTSSGGLVYRLCT